jgi:hypothetical protein
MVSLFVFHLQMGISIEFANNLIEESQTYADVLITSIWEWVFILTRLTKILLFLRKNQMQSVCTPPIYLMSVQSIFSQPITYHVKS